MHFSDQVATLEVALDLAMKELRMPTVRHWTGREANALRAASRMSIRGFAEHLGVGVRTVAKWQARGADVTLRPAMQSVLDTALDRADPDTQARFELLTRPGSPAATTTPDQRLVLSSARWQPHSTETLGRFMFDHRELDAGTASQLANDWRVVEPPQIVEVRAGRRIGERLAQLVIERADTLRRMDDFLGGGDLHDLVRRELHATIDMVRDASYTEQTGRSLLTAVGELAHLAGWVASDAGLYQQAERYYLGGMAAAHAAQDEPLAANLLSSLAYQVANIGDPRDAVLLASSACNGGAPYATPTTRALLLERVAWANARLGDTSAMERALGEVETAFADSDPSEDPPWVYWLNQNEIDVMAGRCFTQLKRPRQAITLLSTAISQYDDTHARELALYLSWLAEAHVYAEQIEEAATYALRALRLSAGVTSERGTSRMRLIRHLLTPYRGNPTADTFEEAAQASLNADQG